MKFQATEDQIKQIAANAINASKPMGFGYLHHSSGNIATPSDIELNDSGIDLDYVGGRMVKLFILRTEDGWEILDHVLDPEYQSWLSTYPTAAALVQSANAAT